MKHRVEKRRPSNLNELNKFLYDEWNKVDMLIINNLIISCLALIESKGELIIVFLYLTLYTSILYI